MKKKQDKKASMYHTLLIIKMICAWHVWRHVSIHWLSNILGFTQIISFRLTFKMGFISESFNKGLHFFQNIYFELGFEFGLQRIRDLAFVCQNFKILVSIQIWIDFYKLTWQKWWLLNLDLLYIWAVIWRISNKRNSPDLTEKLCEP